MSVNINDNLANDVLTGINQVFDGGTLTMRAGARPANAQAAQTGTIISIIPVAADSFAVPAARSMAANGLPWEDTSADAAGTIGWAVLENAAKTRRMDFTVTATGGGGDIEVEQTVVALGQDIRVTSFSISYP
jgi:hypothetical protein